MHPADPASHAGAQCMHKWDELRVYTADRPSSGVSKGSQHWHPRVGWTSAFKAVANCYVENTGSQGSANGFGQRRP